MNKSRERVKGDDNSILLNRLKAAYFFARKYSSKKKILDIGCSDGYGSFILAKRGEHVVAFDKDKQTIKEAKEKHKAGNLEFLVADANHIPWLNKFDLVVSFQVIEHMKDVGLYLKKINKTLKKNGIVILSTPNRKLRLNDGQKPWNKFHITEYDQMGLIRLLERYFKTVKIYGLHSSERFMRIEKRRLYFRRKIAEIDILGLYHHIPSFVTDFFLKKIKDLLGRTSKSVSFREKVWVDDINIDDSLDLIAVCIK